MTREATVSAELYAAAASGRPGHLLNARPSVSGDGSATVFRFSHPFDTEPAWVKLRAHGDAEGTFWQTEVTTEYVEITYRAAPPAGRDNLTWEYAAGFPSYATRETDTPNPDITVTMNPERDETAAGDTDADTTTVGPLTRADLGRLNKRVRESDSPDYDALHNKTLAWLAGETGIPRTRLRDSSLAEIRTLLTNCCDAEAVIAFNAACSRAAGWDLPPAPGAPAEFRPHVSYHFTRQFAPDYDADADTTATEPDPDLPATTETETTDRTMPDFDLADHIETETVTHTTTETTTVPATTDADGEIIAERDQEIAVEQEVTVVAGGCQREGCTEADLPVDAAVPVMAGVTTEGFGRHLEAWCPFCARSVYGDAAVDGELETIMPDRAPADTTADTDRDDTASSWVAVFRGGCALTLIGMLVAMVLLHPWTTMEAGGLLIILVTTYVYLLLTAGG